MSSASFSSDGLRIVTGGYDSKAKVWDARFSFKGHSREVTSIAFSLDGTIIFAWDTSDKVLAWSTEDGKPVAADNPPAKPARGVARSPDGHFVAKPNGLTVSVTGLRKSAGSPSPFPDADERLRYHTEQAALAETEGQAFAASFHLGHLLRLNPLDASLHVRLAHVLAESGQRDKAALHLTQALLLNPRVSLHDFAARKGHAAANAADWPRAARHFKAAVRQSSATADDWASLLMAQLATKDEAACRVTVAELLAAAKRAAALAFWFEGVPLEKAEADRLAAITK